mgnify:CR=1 FL=1
MPPWLDKDKKKDDDEDILCENDIFANLKIGTVLNLNKITSTEKYKNPPPRYTEASLIKKMELLGIGRPSTYANIIDTILDRNYVEKKDVDGKKVDTCEFTYVNNNKNKDEITKKVIKPNTISKIPLICYLYDPLYVQIHLGFHANYFL